MEVLGGLGARVAFLKVLKRLMVLRWVEPLRGVSRTENIDDGALLRQIIFEELLNLWILTCLTP